MSDGILLDTSFLISLADPNRPHHAVARRYFDFFIENGILMFLSTIVASEFQLKQPVTDLPLDAMIVLPFNLTDAIRAGELNFKHYQGVSDVSRVALKDDFKLLGQAKAQQISFLITEDARSLYKFCEELRAKGLMATRAIKLDDPFDKSHFDPAQQLPDQQSALPFDASSET